MTQNPAAPMTISYIRFSSAIQAQGDSLRRQSALAERWCQANGATLSDTVTDLGVSAFKGDNTRAGLAVFLDAVKGGTIPPGSILLIENLDRLSRQQPEVSLQLFLGIINSGITIITLTDGCRFEAGKLDMGRLMMSVMSLCLAHEESKKKSERIRAAYTAKRKGGKIISGTIPSWCKMVDGKIVLDDHKSDIIREMAAMAINGNGNAAIAKAINAKYPNFCTKGYVAPSNVHFMLKSRSLIGEHQPQTLSHNAGRRIRTPIGQPIPDYYPRVLSDDVFFAVQNARAGRRHSGGPSTTWTNIFSGILRDVDGSTMTIVRSGGRDKHRSYVSSAATRGSVGASPYVAFPVIALESAILVQLSDVILPAMATTSNNDGAVKVASLTSQIEQLDNKIKDIQGLILNTSAASVVAMLTQLDDRRKGLVKELDAAKAETAAMALAPFHAAREQLATLVSYCGSGTSSLSGGQRVQAKAALARVVKSITSKFSMIVGGRQADVTVELVDGRRFEMVIAAIKGLCEPIVRGQRFVACGSVVMPTEMAGAISQQYSDELAVAVAA